MLIGLVGRPNTGKSTFFKAATLAEVEIANYPFATIKPHHAIGYVRVECIDKDFGKQCNPREGFCLEGNRFVPIELKDVAGLVPGASEGKGLGNQFLDDLREADAFILVLDTSGKTNEEGKPAENYYSGKDVEFLEKELDLWYNGILKKVWKTFARQLESSKQNFVKAVANQFTGLKVIEEHIERAVRKTGLDVEKPSSWSEDEIFKFASELRKESKPIIIAANKSDTDKAKENLEKLKEEFDYKIIPCSAESELALREAARDGLIKYIPGDDNFEILQEDELNEKQKKALEFVKGNVLKSYGSTGVQDILNYAVFELLEYVAVFPAGVNKLEDSEGNVLPDCHLLPPKSTAHDFAYKIHKDFGDNFIKAINAKTKQIVGKEYELKHRDAIEIIT